MSNTLYVLKEVKLVRYGREWSSGELLNDHLFLCVADGWGELDTGNGRFRLEYGRSVHLSPGCCTVFRSLPDHYPLQVYRIVVERLELMEASDAHRMFRKTGNRELDVTELPAVAPHRQLQQLLKLERLWHDEQGRDKPELQHLFRELLAEWEERQDEPVEATGEHKLATAVAYVRKHYAGPVSRDDVAHRIGMNPDYFSVWFKRATGQGFSAYLNQLRLERARHLLLSSGRTIQEVAEQAGFGDPFYFSRKFKQLTGEAPSVFAAREKRIVALQHAGHLLALGVKPVGAAETYLSRWGIAGGELAETTVIGEHFHENEIADLQPDLIIGHQYVGDEWAKRLQSIAPTVIIPYNRHSPFDTLHHIAELLGKHAEAEAFRKRYEAQGERAKQRLGDAVKPGETVAYYEFRPPYVWLMCEANGRGIYNLYHTFGFAAPAALRTNVLEKGESLRIELAKLPEYAADHMLVGVYDPEHVGEEPCTLQQLFNYPLWGELPAAAAKRIHLVDLTAFAASDTTALYWQLPLQANYLAGQI